MAQALRLPIAGALNTRRSLAVVERRLGRLVRSWPTSLAAEFRAYRYERCGGSWIDWEKPTSGVDGSYWLVLPVLLYEKYGGKADVGPGALLGDTLWAQYCVFLAVRTQDDLLDGQAGPRRVAGAVERLDLEARRTLARYFPRSSPFWPRFERALQTTNHAIGEVDRLQQSALGMPPGSQSLYAEVGEIFKISSAAVCIARDQTGDLDRVSRCCDHLAIASQILDDLVDLSEDLERGRRSFAAGWILRYQPKERPAAGTPESAVWAKLARGDTAKALLDLARTELRQASREIVPVQLPVAEKLIDLLLQEVDLFESHLHRSKVALVFGDSRSTVSRVQ